MGMLSAALDSSLMPRQKREETEQFNVKLPKTLIKRLREYCNATRFHPSFTDVAEAALTEFLDREMPQPPKPKK